MPGGDRRHPRRRRGGCGWLVLLTVLVLVGAGVATWRLDLVDRWWPKPAPDAVSEPELLAPPPGLELPAASDPAEVAVAVRPKDAGRVRVNAVRRALAAGLSDRDIRRHVVAAVGSLDGTGPSYSSSGDAVIPASTLKLITGVGALSALGPEHRFTTRVVQGPGNRVVLVGGGDPYLASRPVPADEQDTTWPARADVRTLAAQVARSLRQDGRTRVTVGYDASLFSGPDVSPRWEAGYVVDDVVSPVSALWVDEGRDPSGYGRVSDPAASAAAVFAAALAERGIKVQGTPTSTPAGSGAPVLGEVSGAALGDVVERVLAVSDNDGAEVLLRHVGLEVAGAGSFSGGVQGVRTVLRGLGVDVGGDVWWDGSGLSRANRVSPDTLLQVLAVAGSGAHPELRDLLTGLPVAGFSGSLTYRFDQDGTPGLGRVRAKTGTLVEGGVHGLAGTVTDRTGGVMLFVIVADRVKESDAMDARRAIDDLAADLAACACTSPRG